jgi:6-phosphofructokinase 2
MKPFDIVTLTVNPALDKSTHFKGLVAEQKIRCEEPRFDAGGGESMSPKRFPFRRNFKQ